MRFTWANDKIVDNKTAGVYVVKHLFQTFILIMGDTHTTKERLLQAAGTLFSEKGFKATTVAEICERAEANIAAVNYHFGDKESLYDAVWRQAFEITSDTYPVDGSLPDNPTLEDYIFSFANALIHRFFSEGRAGLFPKLLHQEMSHPTLALERIANEVLFPQTDFLRQAVRNELEHSVPEDVIQLCMHSIIGQCVHYNFSRALRERVIGKKTMTEEEKKAIARHIATFSMGGLKAIKETQTYA
jgi:AcrR family transcriptional regulator